MSQIFTHFESAKLGKLLHRMRDPGANTFHTEQTLKSGVGKTTFISILNHLTKLLEVTISEYVRSKQDLNIQATDTDIYRVLGVPIGLFSTCLQLKLQLLVSTIATKHS